ncbi:hypothetical protein AKJ09_05419 [Labilithrix luteola]|uniref:Secreted protein n=1 Tax=Labilithrix luteola TaxID=1391654 RepID=A0A0K1PZ02_9BACT|nr:hypothetical protein [Labilithrix luteola]AKU98755.1 hypothetical protein AKJ09_05419 [Labilithrix luteola]
MNVGRLRRAVLPALGVFAALVAPAACAENNETSNPNDTDNVQTDQDAAVPTTPEAGNGADAGQPEQEASSRETCSAGGFCTTPLPATFPLLAVTALDADAWAVGTQGVLRWDGTAWNHVHATTIDPSGAHDGVWTAKADDLWVAADRKVIRYSKQGGAAAGFREFANDFAVNASWLDPSANALWEVIRQDDGQSAVRRFVDAPEGGLTVQDLGIPVWPAEGGSYHWSSIWGFGPSDVYVGGERCMVNDCTWASWALRGAMAHYDGTSWSVTLLDEGQSVMATFGTPGQAEPKRLWFWVGYRTLYNSSMTTIRLVPIASDGSLGDPIVTKDMPMPPRNRP